MNRRDSAPAFFRLVEYGRLGIVVLLMSLAPPVFAQQQVLSTSSPAATETTPRRVRLIMKDGSYQLVLSYTVAGKIVHYRSAERNGETEDVPLALVDLPATEKWSREHSQGEPFDSQRPPVLSPELAKEEAERAARTPEVAAGLRLPEEDSILALENFHGAPELVPLEQQGGDLNKETAHDLLKLAINPASSPHRITELRGSGADVQLHIAAPVFYVRVGSDDEGDPGSGAITVDTHGAGGRATPSGGAENSGYVIVRLNTLSDSRIVNSFHLSLLGVKPQPDVIEMKAEDLPGGHWMKLTPVQPLDPGEYALVEVLSSHELNQDVWDFGIHPDAAENTEAIHPEPQRPATLERREP